MNKLFAFTITLFLSLFTSYAQELNIGDQAPEFELPGADGEMVSLYNIKSKVIILDFWASWCAPCLKAVKTTLKPLYDAYDRSEVEIIGISNDINEDKWRGAINKWGLTWKNVWDPDQSLAGSYQVVAIPTYFIIDTNGKVLASNVNSSQLKGEVIKALNN